MRRPACLVPALLSIALAALAMDLASAQPPCPTGCTAFGQTADGPPVPFCRSNPTGDDSWAQYAAAHATYNAPQGTISLSCYNLPSQYPAAAFDGSVRLTDEFRITGLPAGPTRLFEARLLVSGEGTNYQFQYPPYVYFAFAQTEIGLQREGFTAQATRTFASSGQPPYILEIIVSAAPEEPFTLTLFASFHDSWFTVPSGFSKTHAEGSLFFGGLPPGAVVVSCGGYSSDSQTKLRASTWGRLKLLYR
jgi:hypothetical protein